MARIGWLVIFMLIESSVAAPDPTKQPCNDLGGTCQSNQFNCPGAVWSGPGYCKKPKKFQCCVPSPPGCPTEDGFFYQSSSNQCFKYFGEEKYTFTEAADRCASENLTLPHAYDAVGLRWYMLERYGNPTPAPWLNAIRVGSTTDFIWQDNNVTITPHNPLWRQGRPGNNSENCMLLAVHPQSISDQPNNPYWNHPCSLPSHILCEFALT